MTDFFSSDLGILCFAFWIVLGFLVIWYIYKICPLTDNHGNPQESNNEEISIKNSLLGHFKESEILDHQEKDDDLHNPEQSTNS